MKKCLDCSAEVAEGAYVCSRCGGKSLMGSYSGADALSMLDNLKNQQAAAEHVDRGAKLFFDGRYDESAAELRKAIELAPMNATAHGNMGHLLMRQGKHAEAVPWLEKALQLNPTLEGAAGGWPKRARPLAVTRAVVAASSPLPAMAVRSATRCACCATGATHACAARGLGAC